MISLSKVVKIINDPLRGRCVVASKPLSPGDVVLSTKAEAYVPSNNASRCASCFTSSKPLRRCKGCSYAHYCSQACQKKDWKDGGHSKSCKYIQTLRSRLENDSALSDTLLLIRIFCSESSIKSVSSMHFHTPSSDLERSSKRLIHTARSVVPLLSKFPREVLLKTLYRFVSNNFAITDDLLLKVGAGVFPEGALFNHDCVPNCVVTYCGLVQNIRCTRHIREGEELTHSYVDVFATTSDRQSELFKHYKFKCNCSMCSNSITNKERDQWIGKKMRQSSDKLRLAEKFALRAGAEDDINREIEMLNKCLRIRESCCHPCDHLILKTRNALMSAHLSVGNYEKAAIHCDVVVHIYSKIYHSMHPMTALQLSTLGNLHVELGNVQKGLDEMNRALSVLKLTHGNDSDVVKSLVALVHEHSSSCSS